MTTKDNGITYPVWGNLRLINGIFEVSGSSSSFAVNAAYKYTSTGIFPLTQIAPVVALPQDLNVQSQDANAGFAAVGGNVKLTTGVGSVGNTSGNVSIQDTAGNGGAFNTSHLILGTYHFWLDASGRLRSKNGIPANATDGIVVGFDLTGTAIYDPPNLADGAGVTTTIAVVNSALGDFAIASFSLDLQGISVTAWVSVAGTVSIRFQNESGGALDLGSGNLKVKVIKQ